MEQGARFDEPGSDGRCPRTRTRSAGSSTVRAAGPPARSLCIGSTMDKTGNATTSSCMRSCESRGTRAALSRRQAVRTGGAPVGSLGGRAGLTGALHCDVIAIPVAMRHAPVLCVVHDSNACRGALFAKRAHLREVWPEKSVLWKGVTVSRAVCAAAALCMYTLPVCHRTASRVIIMQESSLPKVRRHVASLNGGMFVCDLSSECVCHTRVDRVAPTQKLVFRVRNSRTPEQMRVP